MFPWVTMPSTSPLQSFVIVERQKWSAAEGVEGALCYSQDTLTENELQSRRDGRPDFQKKAEPGHRAEERHWQGSYASE